MTTTRTTDTRPLAVAATLGTLPYLALKIAWLTGHPVGVDDPALIASPSMVALNAATVGLDLAVIVLAAALTCGWGRRLAAVTVLLPAWVATGLLVPIALAGLPAAIVAAAGAGGDPVGLAGWVRPLVYGGFAWQAVFLLAAFAAYAGRRWPAAAHRPVPGAAPLLRACAGGGATTAALSAGLAVLGGVRDGGWISVAGGLVNAAFACAGILGVLALARGRTGTLPVVAGWTGSAVLFAGSLWSTVTTMGGTDLAGSGDPAVGLAQVAGLLAGFALAVAGLLAVSGDRSPAGLLATADA